MHAQPKLGQARTANCSRRKGALQPAATPPCIEQLVPVWELLLKVEAGRRPASHAKLLSTADAGGG